MVKFLKVIALVFFVIGISILPCFAQTPTPTSTSSLSPIVQPRMLTQSEIEEIIWTFGPYHRGNFLDRIHVGLLSRYLSGKIDESEIAGVIKTIAGYDPGLGIPADKAEQLSPLVRRLMTKGLAALNPHPPQETPAVVYSAVDQAFDASRFSFPDLGVDGGRLLTAQLINVYSPTDEELVTIGQALEVGASKAPTMLLESLQSADVCKLLSVLQDGAANFSAESKLRLREFTSRTGC